MSAHRFAARAAVLLTAAGTAVLLGSGVASAHVTAKVIGESAAQGGYTKITFRVPNEDNTAGTVKLEVRFPQDTPVSSLRTTSMPGWTAAITKTKLATPITVHGAQVTEAVSTVTWTAAAGTRINPGEFAEFAVSGGPLPQADQLVMPAIQTYDSGKVVAWDAPPPAAGADEPEHPAPVIKLSKDGDDEHAAVTAPGAAGGTTGTDTHAGAEGGGTTAAPAAAGSDNTARWLGGAGLVVGALGLGLGAGATLRARRAIAASKAGE
ncbi:YcnI family protein [Actinokineospora enzanensis]|uniref:YcnI family copper-binding membrane protein n=1 Tax=Actinokineospora enzanensis TaxID=155975 RepID=UPI000379CC47|nr:YcnI family protein [Actinokineospora enzanensis]